MNKPLTRAPELERIPYQKPQPRDMRPDMVILDGMAQQDPRAWVPLSEHAFSRPLQFNVTLGQYTHVLRVTKAGVIARHRHHCSKLQPFWRVGPGTNRAKLALHGIVPVT